MDEQLRNKLYQKYPKIFPHPTEISCGKGWYWLIDETCNHIQQYIDSKNEGMKYRIDKQQEIGNIVEKEIPQFVSIQIKEKMSSMRFYGQGGDDFVRGIISHACWLSDSTCENCGTQDNVGKTTAGWILTLCENCYRQRFPNESLWEKLEEKEEE